MTDASRTADARRRRARMPSTRRGAVSRGMGRTRITACAFILACAVIAGCASAPTEIREDARIRTGRLLYDHARYEDAARHFAAVMADADRDGDPLLRAQCLKWLGNLQLAYKRDRDALPLFLASVRILDSLAATDPPAPVARLIDDERENVRNDVAVAYTDLRRYDDAEAMHRAVLEYDRRRAEPLPIAVTLYNIGLLHYLRALDLPEGDSVRARLQLDTARALYRESLRVYPTADAFLNLGNTFALAGTLDSAIASFSEADSIYRRDGYPVQRALCLGNIGVLQIERGRTAEAVAALEQAIGIVEALRGGLSSIDVRSSFISNKYFLYENIIDVLVSTGRVAEAFSYVERAKARSFLDMLGNKAIGEEKQRDARTAALVSEERDLHARIAASLERPDSAAFVEPLLRRHQAVLDSLHRADPEYASVKSIDPPGAPEIQALLDDSTALIEYFVGEQSSFVFLLRRDTIVAKRLAIPPEFGLDGRIERLRQKIYALFPRAKDDAIRAGRLQLGLSEEQARSAWYRTPTDSTWQYDLMTLAVKLLLPVDVQLRGIRQLYVVPHGSLHHLPFHALILPAGIDRRSGMHIARPHYLIEDMAVAYLPSAGVLPFARRRDAAPAGGGLVVGDPLYADPVFRRKPLQGALIEADSVAAEVPSSLLLVRGAAEESRVKSEMPHSGVVHLATHGELDMRDPLRSRILLAAAHPHGDDDGNLTVAEVFNLDLHSSLVTLSACQTAQVAVEQGTSAIGDELVGLTRSFLYAGTASVLASLWYVDDAATLSWMTHFYRAWIGGRMSKAQAARAACLEMLDAPADPDWVFPYYWGAFILFGDMK